MDSSLSSNPDEVKRVGNWKPVWEDLHALYTQYLPRAARTSDCTKARELLKAYCSNIYTVLL